MRRIAALADLHRVYELAGYKPDAIVAYLTKRTTKQLRQECRALGLRSKEKRS